MGGGHTLGGQIEASSSLAGSPRDSGLAEGRGTCVLWEADGVRARPAWWVPGTKVDCIILRKAEKGPSSQPLVSFQATI